MVAQDVVFSIAMILAGGTFLLHSEAKIGVPYSVLMYLYGLTVGWLSATFAPAYVSAFNAMPPALIFHIFLPILIFEGSYGMKIHALKHVFTQVALLAGPGLLLNTVFVAVPLRLMYPEWSWYSALLLGSLLSATDPVAVVSLLKGLGVDKHLTAIVDGEAIMNDGTAIIMFRVLYPAVVAGTWTTPVPTLILESLRLTFLAYFLGKLFGYVQAFFINKTRDDMVVTCLTVSLTFISYFVAEQFVGTSGVLTLFFQGLHLSFNSPSIFPGKRGDTMHSVWEFLVHLGNTILFSLVGIMLAGDVHFTLQHVWKISVLYVTIVVARLIMILCMTPLLRAGQPFKVNPKQILLLTHSGLRGGVAATLALSVSQDPDVGIGPELLKLTSGVVFLTLVINATTASRVVTMLKFNVCRLNKHVQMQIALQHLDLQAQNSLANLIKDPAYTLANWETVNRILLKFRAANPLAGIGVEWEGDGAVVQTLLMRAFKVSIWRQRDAETISERVARLLTNAVSRCMFRNELLDAKHLPRVVHEFPMSLALKLVPQEWTRPIVQSVLEDQFMLLFAAASAYRAVAAAAPAYTTTTASKERALEWVKEQLSTIESEVQLFALGHRESTAFITKMAVKTIFAQCGQEVSTLHEEQGFSANVCDALRGVIEAAVEGSDLEDWDATSVKELEIESAVSLALSSLCSQDSCISLARLFAETAGSPLRARPGSVISSRDGIHLILTGVARGVDGEQFGSGAILGASINLLESARLPHVTWTCLTDVSFLRFSAQVFQTILRSDMSVLWRSIALETVVPVLRARAGYLDGWETVAIANEIRRAMVIQICDDGGVANAPSSSDFQNSGDEGRILVVPSVASLNLHDHTRSALFFLSGGDMTGLFSPKTVPCVVPRVAHHARWFPGTILLHVVFRHDLHSAESSSSPLLSSANQVGSFSDREVTEGRGEEMSDMDNNHNFARPSPRRIRLGEISLAMLATPSPEINALLTEYLWSMEIAAAGSTQAFSNQLALFDVTVAFLLRFATLMPALERRLMQDSRCDASWSEFADALVQIYERRGITKSIMETQNADGIEASGLQSDEGRCDLSLLAAWMRQFIVSHSASRLRSIAATSNHPAKPEAGTIGGQVKDAAKGEQENT